MPVPGFFAAVGAAAALNQAAPSGKPPRSNHEFDALFDQYRGEVPLSFVRALVKSESDFDPDSDMREKTRDLPPARRSTAVGLFQVMDFVLSDYNKARGTSWTLDDLKGREGAERNTQVGTDLLRRILSVYRRHPSLQPAWSDPRFLALLYAGYNAGYVGVARLVGKMEAAGVSPDRVTVDTVNQAAKAMLAAGDKSAQYLADDKRLAYWKKVAARALDEARGGRLLSEAPMEPSRRRPGMEVMSAKLLLIPLGAVLLLKAHKLS